MNYIKKQIIVTAIAVFIGSLSFAQTTDVTITTQDQVNAWTDTSVTGGLFIRGTGNITNLEGLSELETVGGQLVISGRIIISLTGLGNLESVGGNLLISNTSLTSLSALTNLTSVGGFLDINSSFAPKQIYVTG